MTSKDEEESQARGFKVQDRRRFVDTEETSGETREPPSTGEAASGGPTGAEPPRPAEHSSSATEGILSGQSASAEADAPLAEMSFSSFVMGLTTQALMHLGEIPDPSHERINRDLPAAKQMIDLLGILREKTKGNLDAAEEQLLGNMLYDLRIRYVEVARGR